MKPISKKDRLAYFSALLEEARSAYASELAELALCKEQYLGSKKIDGSQEDACTVRNVTYELIECQVSPDIPSPKVEPFSYSEERSRAALEIERLCSRVIWLEHGTLKMDGAPHEICKEYKNAKQQF